MSERTPSSTEPQAGRPELEQRTVEVDDPELSPEANRILTAEVREAVGAERVTVPRERPHPSHGEQVDSPSLASLLSTQPLVVAASVAGVCIFAAVVALVYQG